MAVYTCTDLTEIRFSKTNEKPYFVAFTGQSFTPGGRIIQSKALCVWADEKFHQKVKEYHDEHGTFELEVPE